MAIYFGYKYNENTYAKIGFYLGIITISFLVLIKIIFPLITGITVPIAVFESCSMHHNEKGFKEIFNSQIYSDNSINLMDTQNWDFQKGINKGDVVLILPTDEINIGNVILFKTDNGNTILHRVISTSPLMTKGDNNAGQLSSEKSINESRLIGKIYLRIPFIGWSKLIFSDYKKVRELRGFC